MAKDLADTLRAAIRKSKQPLLTISRATGVSVGRLSEFMAGKDIRLATASKLARYFGLSLKS